MLAVLQLDIEAVLKDYTKAKKRLLVLGYNATLTTAVEAPRQPKRHFDQIQVQPWLVMLRKGFCMPIAYILRSTATRSAYCQSVAVCLYKARLCLKHCVPMIHSFVVGLLQI